MGGEVGTFYWNLQFHMYYLCEKVHIVLFHVIQNFGRNVIGGENSIVYPQNLC